MSDRRLILTWALLMGLTVVTGIAGGVMDTARLGALWLPVLALVTVIKGRLILARYLRLERAPGFLGGFTTAIAAAVVLVTVSFMVISKPLLTIRPIGVVAPSSTVAATIASS